MKHSFLRRSLVGAASLVGALTVTVGVWAAGGKPYIVEPGDTLSGIAQAQLGNANAWPALWLANNHKAVEDRSFRYVPEPTIIRSGHKLWIPDPAEVAELMEHYKHEAEHSHWGYFGEAADWAHLGGENAACGNGREQSPINVAGTAQVELATLNVQYRPSAIRILNNGHTVQLNYDPGSYIELDGKRFDLLQFHFHIPSEHRISGRLSDMEVHFVHRAADGTLAVVGVMLEQGAENPTLVAFWDRLPMEETPERTLPGAIDASELLPAVRTTYRYNGSLTTPPCSEGVLWNLMTRPLTMSWWQIDTFHELFEVNARPVQPLFDRTVATDR